MRKAILVVSVLCLVVGGIKTPTLAQAKMSPTCINVIFNGDDTTMEANTSSFFDDLDGRHLGINCLSINFFLAMNGKYGTKVFEDPTDTLSMDHIRVFTEEAIKRGYSVCLKP